MTNDQDQLLALGTTIGLPIAPTIRYGRVVGIVHGETGPYATPPRYVVREYLPGDGDYPTGPTKVLPRPFVRQWREASG